MEDQTWHDENTLFKVHKALSKLGYLEQNIIDMITVIQNEGILFRERRPDGNHSHN